jgi:FtsP/CotA-like multicopper oxidase with cupredoxin domain
VLNADPSFRPVRRRDGYLALEGRGPVDILLDVTNVGRWMAHCHIAEHHESGMMFSFNVEE